MSKRVALASAGTAGFAVRFTPRLTQLLNIGRKRMQMIDGQRSPPAFQQIKEYVLGRIRAGEWKEGDLIPSEDALTKTFAVSRMTVNRALRELAAEQIVFRVQGSGTFVAQPKYQATLVEIKNIADEIQARGHIHRGELHKLERTRATDKQATEFNVKSGAPLFHSLIVHFENELPIQVEDRWVNAEIAPLYMAQDFQKITPNHYLMKAAPLERAIYNIEAVIPLPGVANMLRISIHDPCLLLKRKTFSASKVASTALMWHPGRSYQFSGEI